MSEAVEILIKADDQASQKFAESSTQMIQSMKRTEQIMNQLEGPADKYARQLEEIAALHKSGAMSAEQFAAAETMLKEKMISADKSIKEVGEKAKVTTEFIGTLASLAGGSEFASFASQIAGATEKVGQFSEVAKAGGAGAMTFKLGLVGLAAAIGSTVGKAIGDFIFQTRKFEREFARLKATSEELDAQLQKTRSTLADNRIEDIELIRDPEKKQAAYQDLLGTMNRDIAGVTKQLEASQVAADKWDDAWQITGDRKEFAADAKKQVEADKERLKVLKEQRDSVRDLASQRTKENEALRMANEAKDKSEGYLETLRQEVELLKASKEEQLQIEAAKNTVAKDRNEAEQLLRERDAIVAKMEAEKELEQERQRVRDEQQRAAEQALQQAEQEKQRLDDLVKSEAERLELRRIELERGKEAAKVQSLINQGVDEATAKAIAAEEASLDLLQQKKQEEQDGKKVEPDKKSETGPLQASESRLLTRGEGSGPMDKLKQSFDGVKSEIAKQNALQAQSLDAQRKIAENTGKGSVLVPVS
jgi:hypothetical protein